MTKRFLNLSLLLVLAVGSVLPLWQTQQADAALVTYEFSGNISQVPGALFTPGGAGANGFNSGLKLSGTYTFETTTPGLLPSGFSTQMYNGSLSNLQLSIGNYGASLNNSGTNLTMVSTGGTSLYSVNAGVNGNLVKGLAPSLFSINLADETGTAFSSVALPGNPGPSLSSFNVNRWTLVFSNGSTLVGSLDSLKAVPLPATVLLFGAGLIGLVGLGARGRFSNSASRA
ncbi:MAG: hypothetical protein KF814_13415 [Nitrospiraceae bacterium]|nr:hypothetical protein [Nitrospiraceae bacterium]